MYYMVWPLHTKHLPKSKEHLSVCQRAQLCWTLATL